MAVPEWWVGIQQERWPQKGKAGGEGPHMCASGGVGGFSGDAGEGNRLWEARPRPGSRVEMKLARVTTETDMGEALGTGGALCVCLGAGHAAALAHQAAHLRFIHVLCPMYVA